MNQNEQASGQSEPLEVPTSMPGCSRRDQNSNFRDGLVKACPKCGSVFAVHCWHDEVEEVSTVWLPVKTALQLAENYLQMAQDEVGYRQSTVDELNQYLAGNQ